MCLFSSLGIFNRLSSLLAEEVLFLKVFPLERESVIRGSGHVYVLKSRG